MIVENLGLFSDDQSLAGLGQGTNRESEHWMDLGVETGLNSGETATDVTYRDWSAGAPLYINFLVTQQFTITASESVLYPALQIVAYIGPSGVAGASVTPSISNAANQYLGCTEIMNGALVTGTGAGFTALDTGSKLCLALSPQGGMARNNLTTGLRYLRVCYLIGGDVGSSWATGALRAQLSLTPDTFGKGVAGTVIANVYPATHNSAGT